MIDYMAEYLVMEQRVDRLRAALVQIGGADRSNEKVKPLVVIALSALGDDLADDIRSEKIRRERSDRRGT